MVQLAVSGNVKLMADNTLRHLGVPRVEQFREYHARERTSGSGEDMCCLCRLSHLHHAAPARAAGRTGTGWDI
jgi:hypothetical protein